ncbi:MAG: amino acid adenylation domain-containing protein [Rhodomicrobium sp.]
MIGRTALLHDAVEAWAGFAPESPAVDDYGVVWSYAELRGLMRRIAALLRSIGVGRNDRVAILMDNGAQAYAAILGALAADACFVPLNPSFPALRLASILRQAEPAAAITLAQHLPLLSEALGASAVMPVIVLDAESEGRVTVPPSRMFWKSDVATASSAFTPSQNREEDLAYILFTSGTTGQPKGVMLSHRAVMSTLRWGQELWALSPADRLANHSRLTFDVSMFDIFVGFLAGGTVCPVTGAKDLTFPGEFIKSRRITVWCSVPGVIGMMIKSRQLAAWPFADLRIALFIGEVLPAEWALEWRRHQPQTPIYNTYGPTEAAIFCTAHNAGVDGPLEAGRPVPIGLPSTDSELFVLRMGADELAAPGEVGRLMIAGSQLAYGYWRAPEMARRAFRPNPFKRDLGVLMYDTGDLATVDANGVLTWVGRADNQVKVRGYRVELGEIEIVLRSAPNVHDAAVFVATNGSELVAVVVCEPAHAVVDEDALRAHLGRELPSYMIPASFLSMPEFPLNSNGKIDRRKVQEILAGRL